MSNFGRNLALWVIIAVLLVVLFDLFQPGGMQHERRPMSRIPTFVSEMNNGHIRNVSIAGHQITGTLTDGHAVPDLYAGRSHAGAAPDRQGRHRHRQAG